MYYIGNIPCTPSDIQHFGVLGMKWGIRRYQNPDGTLTEAGKKRYGATGSYEYKSIGQRRKQWQADRTQKALEKQTRKMTISDDGENVRIGGSARDFAKLQKLSKKNATRQDQLRAYKERDRDRLNYAKTANTGAAIARGIFNLVAGQIYDGPNAMYQRSRSRGESIGRSILSSYGLSALEIGTTAGGAVLGGVPGAIAGYAAGHGAKKAYVMSENKKKYGRRMIT